jgi:rhodanese-related sulfurtransferase
MQPQKSGKLNLFYVAILLSIGIVLVFVLWYMMSASSSSFNENIMRMVGLDNKPSPTKVAAITQTDFDEAYQKLVAANGDWVTAKVLFVDLRDKDDFSAEHLKYAVSVPLADIEKVDFGLPKTKDYTIIFYGDESQIQTQVEALKDKLTLKEVVAVHVYPTSYSQWKDQYQVSRGGIYESVPVE